MAVFTFKAPIRFVAGTGFTISPNDTDINLSSEVQAVFSIAQDVSPTSTVTGVVSFCLVSVYQAHQ